MLQKEEYMDSSQLLILGNGFDAHCGLASTYKDFFRCCILDTIAEPFGIKQLQAGASGFWENLLLDYYEINGIDDYKWCDIETIIKDVLFSIFIRKSYGGTQLWRIAYKYANSNQKPNEIIPGIESYPIELFLLKYCMRFYGRLKFLLEDEVEQSLLVHLLEQLNNLEQRFCKYLKNQIINPHDENERNEEYIIKAVNLLARLTGFAHYKFYKIDDLITIGSKKYLIDVFDNLNDVFILNFNYTALFDILEVESPCYYNNVHGKLCNSVCANGCDKSNIIFGIDDNLIQSQGASSELRLFSKTYRKMLNSDKYITALPQNDGKELAIKFYGHSLSEADYSYFQSIFDYYDLYKNSNVSLTFYYSNGFENYDAVYKLISVYGKSLTNKEQGKNLIHKLLLENRLHILEIKG